MIDDLIYDVGMNDGCDTAYYLQRGYRVVAIEAIPELCAQAATRFKSAIEQQRLTILNVAISNRSGEAEFWVSNTHPELSSLQPDSFGLSASTARPITVPAQTFDSILRRYGSPHYLKIDIEGSDQLCLEALAGNPDRPHYIRCHARMLLSGIHLTVGKSCYLEHCRRSRLKHAGMTENRSLCPWTVYQSLEAASATLKPIRIR